MNSPRMRTGTHRWKLKNCTIASKQRRAIPEAVRTVPPVSATCSPNPESSARHYRDRAFSTLQAEDPGPESYGFDIQKCPQLQSNANRECIGFPIPTARGLRMWPEKGEDLCRTESDLDTSGKRPSLGPAAEILTSARGRRYQPRD